MWYNKHLMAARLMAKANATATALLKLLFMPRISGGLQMEANLMCVCGFEARHITFK